MSSLNGPSTLHDLYNDVDESKPRRCSHCQQDIDETMHGSDAGLCHDCACEDCGEQVKAAGETFLCADCVEVEKERSFDRRMEML
jgi:hypothetical protein